MSLGKPLWLWFGFLGIVGALLAFDLGVLHRTDREIGITEGLKLSAFYITVALVFGAWVWWYMGMTLALIAAGVLYSLWKTRYEGPAPVVGAASTTAVVDHIKRPS